MVWRKSGKRKILSGEEKFWKVVFVFWKKKDFELIVLVVWILT